MSGVCGTQDVGGARARSYMGAYLAYLRKSKKEPVRLEKQGDPEGAEVREEREGW